MKQTLKKYGKELLLLFVICYLLALWSQFQRAGSWDKWTFHPDAPFWMFLESLLIIQCIRITKKKWVNRKAEQAAAFSRYAVLFVSGLLLFLLLQLTLGVLLAWIFDTWERNFNTYSFTFNQLDHVIFYSIIGNAYLGYTYVKEHDLLKRQALELEKVAVSNQLKVVQQQLDPHFLFNNLNVLSQLIDEDSNKANEFLATFSDLYRYVLQHNDTDLVPLENELTFAKQYLYLMNQRFENGYPLQITQEGSSGKNFVPPFAIQTLIENVVKHNTGTAENPLPIALHLNAEYIQVQNKRRPKSRKMASTQKGLNNLQRQYQLLSGKRVIVEENETYFSVQLPLIKEVEPCSSLPL